MLAWLENELIDSEKNNQTVFIIGHMVYTFLLIINIICLLNLSIISIKAGDS